MNSRIRRFLATAPGRRGRSGKGSVQAQCRDLIEKVAGSEPGTIDEFLQAMSEKRGRLIEAIPVRSDRLGCGFSFWTPEADFFTFPSGVSPVFADHIKAHEIGHYLLGHVEQSTQDGSASDTVMGWLTTLFPDVHPRELLSFVRQLPPELESGEVKGVRQRTIFDTTQEWETENFAGVLNYMVNKPRLILRTPDVARDPLQRLFGPPPVD